jgi:hypothetical protein
MRPEIQRRLKALERRRAQAEEAAETAGLFASAKSIVIAYHLGNLKLNENPVEAFARALKYENVDDLSSDLACMLTEGAGELTKRAHEAYRRLFKLSGRKISTSPAALEEVVAQLAEQLPNKWKKEICDAVERDIHSEKRARSLWRTLEAMAAAELERQQRELA